MADDLVVEQDLSKEDIINLLAEETGEEVPLKEDDGEVKESDEEKPEKEEEKKEDEEKEEIELKEEEDELDFQPVPRRKEILAKYPDLFKTFPGIEKSLYKEQQYSEVFATVSEAKDAMEAVNQYKEFETTLLSGDLTTVLKAVKSADEEAFGRITSNFLQTLATTDKDAYMATVGDVLNHAINNMVAEYQRSGNEDLKTAAILFNQFIFGRTDIRAPQVKPQVQPKDDTREKELESRQRQFLEQQYTVAENDVSTRASNIIKSSVERAIDPKGAMSSYVKGKAINDIMERVNQAVKSDTSFQRVLGNLWSNAFENNFSESAKSRIRSAIISKTKTVLPDIVRAVRSEALKGNRKSANEVETHEKPLARGGPSNENRKAKEPPKGIKTLDFLNMD